MRVYVVVIITPVNVVLILMCKLSKEYMVMRGILPKIGKASRLLKVFVEEVSERKVLSKQTRSTFRVCECVKPISLFGVDRSIFEFRNAIFGSFSETLTSATDSVRHGT